MQEPFACGVEEQARVLGMELGMRNNLLKLIDIRGLHIKHVIYSGVVFNIPQVYPKIICRYEVLSVTGQAQGVDMIFVSVSVERTLFPFPSFIDHLRSGDSKFALLE
jgi:hypothetical protein